MRRKFLLFTIVFHLAFHTLAFPAFAFYEEAMVEENVMEPEKLMESEVMEIEIYCPHKIRHEIVKQSVSLL